MANLGRKISNINTLTSFTAKVVYAASERYGATQSNVTFTVGREYTGPNFFKGLNRPPKLRILSIFQPLVGGSPNATNDTYVAFQIYDYGSSVWRGPYCKRKDVNSNLTSSFFIPAALRLSPTNQIKKTLLILVNQKIILSNAVIT